MGSWRRSGRRSGRTPASCAPWSSPRCWGSRMDAAEWGSCRFRARRGGERRRGRGGGGLRSPAAGGRGGVGGGPRAGGGGGGAAAGVLVGVLPFTIGDSTSRLPVWQLATIVI